MTQQQQKLAQFENRIRKLEFENRMLRAEMDIIRPKKKDKHRINYK